MDNVGSKDPKNLINFIISSIHNELNKAPKDIIPNEQCDHTNMSIMLQNFIKNFINQNQSIISDIFYAVKYNKTVCSFCNTGIYDFKEYFYLTFPLEEIRQYKIQNLQNNFIFANQNIMLLNPILYQQNLLNFQIYTQNMNAVNIYDCFDFYQKINYLTGGNSKYCDICKTKSSASSKNILYTTPEILILILNRGQGIEFNVKLEFIEDLNLMNYVEIKNTGFNYNLIGVITHLQEGDYISFCKNPIDKKWYEYKNENISEVINFKEQIVDYNIPYILIYQKIKNII